MFKNMPFSYFGFGANTKKKDDCPEIFSWLYYPDETMTVEQVVEETKKYNIPHNIILNKIIQALVLEQKDNDEICNILKEKNVIIAFPKDKMVEIIKLVRDLPIHILDDDKYTRIANLYYKYRSKILITNNPLQHERSLHKSMPLPDPKLGRPRLEWTECYHKECHKKFQNTTSLKDHLEKMETFTHNLHKYHEDAVVDNKLTPDKVHKEGIKFCPSWVCNKNREMTPHELCDHLKLFGIFPFWQPGDTCDDLLDKDKVTEIQLKPVYKNSYFNDNCLVCCDEYVEVVLVPCNHYVSCFECSQFTTCPICRCHIEFMLPY